MAAYLSAAGAGRLSRAVEHSLARTLRNTTEKSLADYEKVLREAVTAKDNHALAALGLDDPATIPAVAVSIANGRVLFFNKARCNSCHVGETYTDHSFHNLGVGATKDGDLPLEKIAVHRLHRRHRLAARVLHQHERRDADVLDRPAIGFPHLSGVEDAHASSDLTPPPAVSAPGRG